MVNNNFEQVFETGEKFGELAEYFVGQAYRAPLVDGIVPVANIAFEPG